MGKSTRWTPFWNALFTPPTGDTGRSPLVFLGDLVDRGADSPAVVERVAGMVVAGRTQWVLGNHELNLLRKEGNGWFWPEESDHDVVIGKFEESARASDSQRRDFRRHAAGGAGAPRPAGRPRMLASRYDEAASQLEQTASEASARSRGPNLFAGMEPFQWLGPRNNAMCIDWCVGLRWKERLAGVQRHEGKLGALRWTEREVVLD